MIDVNQYISQIENEARKVQRLSDSNSVSCSENDDEENKECAVDNLARSDAVLVARKARRNEEGMLEYNEKQLLFHDLMIGNKEVDKALNRMESQQSEAIDEE